MPENKKDLKEIEKLYNVKPEKPKDMQYEDNISEIAHKDKVIVSPSYDRLNGLVENINERQKILINIIKQPVTGHLFNKKYAAEDLSKTLVQVANDMDNRKLNKLSKLADICLKQIYDQEIKKQALPILPILIPVGIAAGLIYLKNHSNFNNEGVSRNGEVLIDQLEDLVTSGKGTLSLRSEYSDEFVSQIKHVQSEVKNLLNVYDKIKIIVDYIEAPHTQNDLEGLIRSGQNVANRPTFKSAYELFKVTAKNLQPMLDALVKNFKMQSYKAKQLKNKGVIDSISDFFGGTLYGGKGFVADEFDDVLHAIQPFQESVKEVLGIIAGAETAEKDAMKKVQDAENSFKTLEPSGSFSDSESKNFNSLMQEVENLQQILSGNPAKEANLQNKIEKFAKQIKNIK